MRTRYVALLLGLCASLNAFDYEVHKGWNLLGAVENIDAPYTQIDTRAIVMYKDGYWKFGGAIETIERGYGFWMYSDADGVVSVADSEGEVSSTSEESFTFSSSSSSASSQSNTIASDLSNWLYPSQSFCKSEGASWDSEYDACYGNRDSAENICEGLGATLPKLSDVSSVITSCGGVVGSYASNNKNEEYQACYKELGFRPSFIWVKEASVSKYGAVDMQNGTYNLYGSGNLFEIKCVE